MKQLIKIILIIFAVLYISFTLYNNIRCEISGSCIEHTVSGQWNWYEY